MSENLLLGLAQAVSKHSNSIVSLIDNGATYYTLSGKASALKELAEFSNTLQTCDSKQIFNVFSGLPDECKSLLSDKAQTQLMSPGYWTYLKNDQKKDIIGEIELCQNELVNSILFKEVFCASTLLLTQLNSLMQLSSELKQTGKLVEDSKVKIDAIIEKLDELKADQAEISQSMAEMQNAEKIDSSELDQLSYDLMLLNDKENEVRLSIDKLKVEVSGKIVCLGDQRTGAIRDACVDASQVVGNLIEYSMAGGIYSAGLSSLKFVTTSLFAAMGMAKYRQSQLAAKRIEELSEILKQVENLEKDVNEIKKVLMAAMKWKNEIRKAQKAKVAKIAVKQ